MQTSNETKRQRVLVLSVFAPVPITNGGTERTAILYSNLASKAETIFLWPANPGENGLAQVPGGAWQLSVGLEEEISTQIKQTQLMWGPIGWGPAFGKHIKYSKKFMETVERLAVSADVIILSQPWLIDSIPNNYNGKLIYDAHNFEQELLRSFLSNSYMGVPIDLVKIHESDLISEIERQENTAVALSKQIFCVSDFDMSLFITKYNDKKFTLVNSGVSAENLFKVKSRKKNKVLFFGSSHPPNLDALYIIAELAAAFPKVEFNIYGDVCYGFKNPPRNMKLHGRISEKRLRHNLESATIFVNPINSGAGISLKFLQALHSGIPVLTTSLGARGVPQQSPSIYVESPLSEFQKNLEKMLFNSKGAQVIGDAGKNFVASNYNWEAINSLFQSEIFGKIPSRDQFVNRENFLDHNQLVWYPTMGASNSIYVKESQALISQKNNLWAVKILRRMFSDKYFIKLRAVYYLVRSLK